MSLYILDTDHISLFQRGQSSVVRRVATTHPDQLGISIVTLEEQLRGWLHAIRRA